MNTVVTDKYILCPICKESGIIRGNIMLVIFATIFAPCLIRISYMNAVYKGDN